MNYRDPSGLAPCTLEQLEAGYIAIDYLDNEGGTHLSCSKPITTTGKPSGGLLAAEAGLSAIPVFGDLMGAINALTGTSFSGERLSTGERVVEGAAAFLPFVSGTQLRAGYKLARTIASDDVLARALAGRGFVIAGVGDRRQIDDLPRLIAQYGGSAQDWAKMSTISHNVWGFPVAVHWYENVTTGLRTEFKTNIRD